MLLDSIQVRQFVIQSSPYSIRSSPPFTFAEHEKLHDYQARCLQYTNNVLHNANALRKALPLREGFFCMVKEASMNGNGVALGGGAIPLYRKPKRRSAKDSGLCGRISRHSIFLPFRRLDLALRRNLWTIGAALVLLYFVYFGVWAVYTGASVQKYFNLPVAEQLLEAATLVSPRYD